MRIGIDIMGGDYAPQKTVHGAILALNELPSDTKIVLFGRESEILSELKQYNINANNFEIIDCTDVIDMGEHPTKAFKSKPNSSIAKGFEYLAKGKIDGFASAGNTGAMFVGGYYSVKAITGVLRPAISTLIPREDGGVTVLLDVGANADCKPDVLYQFGILGSLFSEYVCGIKSPKVSLLNLGEEKTKGNMLTQATYTMMEKISDYNFIGNIEGGWNGDTYTGKTYCIASHMFEENGQSKKLDMGIIYDDTIELREGVAKFINRHFNLQWQKTDLLN